MKIQIRKGNEIFEDDYKFSEVWIAYKDDLSIHLESSNEGDQKAIFIYCSTKNGESADHLATILFNQNEV